MSGSGTQVRTRRTLVTKRPRVHSVNTTGNSCAINTCYAAARVRLPAITSGTAIATSFHPHAMAIQRNFVSLTE